MQTNVVPIQTNQTPSLQNLAPQAMRFLSQLNLRIEVTESAVYDWVWNNRLGCREEKKIGTAQDLRVVADRPITAEDTPILEAMLVPEPTTSIFKRLALLATIKRINGGEHDVKNTLNVTANMLAEFGAPIIQAAIDDNLKHDRSAFFPVPAVLIDFCERHTKAIKAQLDHRPLKQVSQPAEPRNPPILHKPSLGEEWGQPRSLTESRAGMPVAIGTFKGGV